MQFFRFIGRELISPVNYLMAGLIGITINYFQGIGAFGSLVPFVVPVLVQTLSKAMVRYQNRTLNLLAQLPGRRPYPAFVLDKEGNLAAHAGLTKALFREKSITCSEDLFGECLPHLLEQSRRHTHYRATLYCKGLQADFEVQAEFVDNCFLVWLSPVSTHHLLSLSDMPS